MTPNYGSLITRYFLYFLNLGLRGKAIHFYSTSYSITNTESFSLYLSIQTLISMDLKLQPQCYPRNLFYYKQSVYKVQQITRQVHCCSWWQFPSCLQLPSQQGSFPAEDLVHAKTCYSENQLKK